MPEKTIRNIDDLLIGREILLSADTVRDRVFQLGAQIAEDYRRDYTEEVTPTGLVVLSGAFMFAADLVRAFAHNGMMIHPAFTKVGSYGNETESSRRPKMALAPQIETIAGQHVLLIEDIVDTGHTLTFLKKKLSRMGPASLKICTLLSKPERREVNIFVDYIGFEIPNVWVEGYGLDTEGAYRNIPHIVKRT